MNYLLEKKEYIISLILIITFKIYYLYLNPVSHGYVTSYSANTLIFYNAKSFLLKAQSFNDWNHPGTPIYYFVAILSKIIGGLGYENFNKYVIAHNVFTLFLYAISINYYFNYFKKFFSKINLLFYLLFFHSFYMSFHTLEFIDPTNYLIPFGLLFLVQTFKLLSKTVSFNAIIKYSFIATLATFTKLSFLPFLISSLCSISFKIFNDYKLKISIKKFSLLIFSFIIFTILWNFPIIGRIPKIIFAAIFTRNDTLLTNEVVLNFLTNFFNFFYDKKLFFLIAIIVMIVFFSYKYLDYFYKIFLKKVSFNDNGPYFIFGLLLFCSFLYTLLNTAREYKLFLDEPGIGDLLRNCFHYSLFIIPAIYLFFRNNKKILIFINILIIFAFVNNLIFYSEYRSNQIKNLDKHGKLFELKTNEILLNKNFAIFNTGYPYPSYLLHHIGNNIFAGERFTNELLDKKKNVYFLRLADIYHDYENHFKNKEKINLDKNINIKKLINKFDNYIKKKLNRSLYLILSPNSFKETSNFIGFPNRSKSLYIPSEKKIDYLLFNSSNKFFKNRNIDIDKFIKFIKEKYNLNILDVSEIQIYDDNWKLIKLN